jgi:hypothetical protein
MVGIAEQVGHAEEGVEGRAQDGLGAVEVALPYRPHHDPLAGPAGEVTVIGICSERRVRLAWVEALPPGSPHDIGRTPILSSAGIAYRNNLPPRRH